MAVNVRDLPPEYQAQALRKYMEQQRQEGPPFPAVSEPQKESKYPNGSGHSLRVCSPL